MSPSSSVSVTGFQKRKRTHQEQRSQEPEYGRRGAIEGCTRAGCGESHPTCFARLSSRCVAMTTTSSTSRWYHLSRWEHYCNACFELCYRGRLANESAPTWVAELRAAWLNAECREPSPRELLANAALPYWASCRDCGRWRQLDVDKNKQNPLDCASLPRRLFEFRCVDCDEAEHPAVAWAASDPEFLSSSLAVPVLLQDNCCRKLLLLSSSVKKKSGGSGGGCRPLSLGLAPLPSDQLIDQPAQLHPFASGLFSFGQPSSNSLSVSPDSIGPTELADSGCDELIGQPQLYLALRNTLLGAWAIWHSALTTSSSSSSRTTTPADWPTKAASRRVESLILCRGLARVRICSAILPAIIRRLERRGLINYGVPPLLTNSTSTSTVEPADTDSVVDVVVVNGPGAGGRFAGLTAARQLINFGRRVVLVEASGDDARLPDMAVIDSVSNNPLCLMALQPSNGALKFCGLVENSLQNVADLFDWPDGAPVPVDSDAVCDAVDLVAEAFSTASAKRMYDSARRKARTTGSDDVRFYLGSECDDNETGNGINATGNDYNTTRKGVKVTGNKSSATGSDSDANGNAAAATGSKKITTGSDVKVPKSESNETGSDSNENGNATTATGSDDISLSKRINERRLLDEAASNSVQAARLVNFHLASLEHSLAAPLDVVSSASSLPFDRQRLLTLNRETDQAATVILDAEALTDLANWLAAGLPSVLRDSPVTRVRWSSADRQLQADGGGGGGVEVSLADGRRVRAACCLLTLPPHRLAGNAGGPEFEPSLPQLKLEAASRLGRGHLLTLRLRFRRRFWSPRRCFAALPPETSSIASRGLCHLFVDPTAFSKSDSLSASLLAVICGRAVDLVTSQPDPVGFASAEAVRRLALIFGDEVVEASLIESALLTDSAGGSAYPVAGRWSTVEDVDVADALAADVGDDGDGDGGRLFFAGEASSRVLPHSLSGACVSGLAAAGRIADWLDARSRRRLLRS